MSDDAATELEALSRFRYFRAMAVTAVTNETHNAFLRIARRYENHLLAHMLHEKAERVDNGQ